MLANRVTRLPSPGAILTVSTASGFSPWVAEPGGFPWPQTGKWSRHGLSGAGQLVLKPECNHKSADIQCKFIVFFAPMWVVIFGKVRPNNKKGCRQENYRQPKKKEADSLIYFFIV